MTRPIEFHSKVWTLFVWNFWFWHDTSFWLKVSSSPFLKSRFCVIRPGNPRNPTKSCLKILRARSKRRKLSMLPSTRLTCAFGC